MCNSFTSTLRAHKFFIFFKIFIYYFFGFLSLLSFSFYYFYNILFYYFLFIFFIIFFLFSFIKIPLLLHPSLNIVTPLRPASHALIYILKTSSTVVSKGIFIVDDIEASIYFCHTFACLFFLHILYS